VAWTHGILHRLGGCCGGRALALNNRGQIVGEANDKEGRFSAFLWDKTHGLQLIPPPGSTSSTALAINDAGHILVQSLAPNAVFLREQNKMTPVELSEESASQPLALNNCDEIVGEYGANSEYYRAFIWDRQNGMRDLNKLADVGKDWLLESAVDINDRGEIVGMGDYKNEDSGFLLVPDPPKNPARKK
jgi:probable HAF family extracellular repeat protein